MSHLCNFPMLQCGAMLKPFLPQLQTTFLKALYDTARSVRLCAANALAQLMIIHVRVDPVFTELINGVKNPSYQDDVSVKETFLHALRLCIVGGGGKMGENVRKEITTTLISLLSSEEDTVRTTASVCLGALIRCLPEEERTDLLINHLLCKDLCEPISKAGACTYS